VEFGGVPHPPPPGVSIRSTSPACTWIVHLSGSRSARSSSPMRALKSAIVEVGSADPANGLPWNVEELHELGVQFSIRSQYAVAMAGSLGCWLKV
jgi:hypothetical protein